MKHLNHCASYPVQLFLFLSICLFVVLRLATAVWLQIWVDDGDGLEEARRTNSTWTTTSTTRLTMRSTCTCATSTCASRLVQ